MQMFQYDFSNHQNRHIRIEDMPADYYKKIQKTTQEDPFYPAWHIAPKCGLLNDPNGLCQINGEHHIFYQWFPAGPVHGLKHWYHVVTEDFIHYRDCGVAMYPDQDFDAFGCYTGMARVQNGKAHLYYTGIEDEKGTPCTCYAKFDGKQISERRKLCAVDPEVTTLNYRDPFVWKRGENYYMLVGGESREHQGIFLLYQGTAPDQLRYRGITDLGAFPFGYMLECPNYFESGEQGVLFFSPMGIQSENKYDYKNVFSVVYAVGSPFDTEKNAFRYEQVHEMDKGFDFYAPQSYQDETGRRILFGWLGNSKSEYPTDKNNWAHMLTMPRELTIEDHWLVQKPVRELERMRRNPKEMKADKQLCMRVEECAFELELKTEGDFVLEIGNEDGDLIRFTGNEAEYCLDRSSMTYLYAQKFGTVRYARRLEQAQTLRVFADHSSLEIFCDSGKTVFTSRMFIDRVSYVKVKGGEGTLYELSGDGYPYR